MSVAGLMDVHKGPTNWHSDCAYIVYSNLLLQFRIINQSHCIWSSVILSYWVCSWFVLSLKAISLPAVTQRKKLNIFQSVMYMYSNNNIHCLSICTVKQTVTLFQFEGHWKICRIVTSKFTSHLPNYGNKAI